MDRIIPFLVVVGVIVLGYIVKIIEIGNLNKRINFTKEYRNKFINLCNDIMTNNYFNPNLYYELTEDVINMQEELGDDGIFAYAQDNLKGVAMKDYQLLVNFLPELRTAIREKENSIMAMRLNQSISGCDDMFVRHMGSLSTQIKATKKQVKNPFSCFAEGIKSIVLLPVFLLKWFGIISDFTTLKIKRNLLVKILNFIVILTGFISSLTTIIIGWDEFAEIICNLF